jgi:hypothetical protein
MTAAVSPTSAPKPTPPQVAHAKQVELLTKHVDYFRSVGDTVRADAFVRELEGTAERIPHDEAAVALVSEFGFGDEVNATSITYTDAVNYVAKVLHECANGEKRSQYQRSHASVARANAALIERYAAALKADPKAAQEVPHVDEANMAAPWDPAAEVIAHLGLEKPEHVAAVRSLFAGKVA